MMQWLAFIIFRLAFFALGATGLVDICGGWFITPFAIFGWVLLFLAIEGWCHSRDLAKAACGLFDSAPQQNTPAPAPVPASTDPAPQKRDPITDTLTTIGASVLTELHNIRTDIETKQHLFNAKLAVAQQQNLEKQAAANAEAAQLKAMKVPNAAA